MLRAVIFDFDGVIVDSEPLIMELTRRMAAIEGWTLSSEEYYRDYLALDDRGIVERLFLAHERPLDEDRRDKLIRWKEEAYARAIQGGLPEIPGATTFVRQCAARYPLAIASGSLRSEVERLLAAMELRSQFAALATADDCEHSKPHPCSYMTALLRLRNIGACMDLKAEECLAIEDAPAGIDAAHAAGMKCMALAHSRIAAELRHAEWVFESFGETALGEIEAAFKGASGAVEKNAGKS